MRIRLAYGTDGLEVDLPRERTTVIVPEHSPALEDSHLALRRAMASPIESPPLRELVSPGQKVAISVCDITRAQPRRQVLSALFAELEGTVGPREVTILIATGTHRANTEDELRGMLGDHIIDSYRVKNHVARDPKTLAQVGSLDGGVPVLLNRDWVEAELRVTTGFVEPHFFAGLSGGPKMVAPGLAGLETVLTLHDARHIGHELATWGVIDGNPIQRDVRAIARMKGARPHFSIDVLLNQDQEITGVFAGELFAMHAAACSEAKRVAMRAVDAPFDVVLTTNSGYPLDQNLYQAIKGMSAAAQVVKQGGTIVCAAECRDGLPDHGRFASMLKAGGSLQELLHEIEAREQAQPDQWQVQVQALIRRRARILVKSDGLSREELERAHFEAIDDVAQAVRAALDEHGPDARLCVLPEGPQTIPYLAG